MNEQDPFPSMAFAALCVVTMAFAFVAALTWMAMR